MKLFNNLKNNIFFLYIQIIGLIQLFFLRNLEINSGTGLVKSIVFMISVPFIVIGFLILLLHIFIPQFRIPEEIVNNKWYIFLFYYLMPSTLIVNYNWFVFMFLVDVTELPEYINIKLLHLISNLYYFWINPVLQ